MPERSPLKEGTRADARQKSGPEDGLVDPIVPDYWPRDEAGEPMIQISVQAREHIGLENFSNVTVGPNGATMFVRRGQDEILDEGERKALAGCMNQLSELVEVDNVAEQRGIFLGSIDPANR